MQRPALDAYLAQIDVVIAEYRVWRSTLRSALCERCRGTITPTTESPSGPCAPSDRATWPLCPFVDCAGALRV